MHSVQRGSLPHSERILGCRFSTLPLLAARLAGGFNRPARSQEPRPSHSRCTRRRRLDGARRYPSASGHDTVQSPATLAKVWQADLDLEGLASHNARLAELAEVERRVRANLPAGVLTPRDLRDAAIAHAAHAAAALGSIDIDQLSEIASVWRPLLATLAKTGPTRLAQSWNLRCELVSGPVNYQRPRDGCGHIP